MRPFAALFAIVCLALVSCSKGAKPQPTEFEGEWEAVRIEAGGRAIPIDRAKDRVYFVRGDQLIPSQNPNDPARMDMKPEKTPAWIDLTDRDNKTMPGIYRVEGDRWEICLGDPGGVRPNEFKTEPGAKSYIMVLQRKKK